MPKRGQQKNVPLGEEDGTHRKGSSGTIKSESGITHLHSSKQPPDVGELVPTSYNRSSMRVKPIAAPSQGVRGQGSVEQIRFPKLEEYAHFHYDLLEIPSLKLSMCTDDASGYKHNPELAEDSGMFLVTVTGSAPKSWLIRRSLENFATLDKQLHRCIFDRRFSHLEDLTTCQLELKSRQEVQAVLQSYLSHFSELAGGMVNCGSVLSWMEMDNRGHRLVATDDSGINTPAIAAAHVIKRYNAQAADEISLQVGDMISVIDMPAAEDTVWWRGKRGFEVGFFPAECVEVIGDKVPTSVASRFPEPLATAAASRRPCEILGDQTSISTTATSITATTAASPNTTPSPSRSSTSTTSSSLGNFSTSSRADTSPTTAHEELPTQTAVMRKHGKLLSFLRTFFSQRPPRNQLKQSGIVKERVFGCDLGEHLLNSGHDVPLLLKSCTDIIEEYGIVHGIYRLSGITSNIQKLRLAFDEDRVPDLTEDCYLQDIHSISSLLKMYFRELPNPLLTYQLYDKFADAVRDEENKLLKIHDVVQQLPPPHYRTTEYLMRHLARVAAFGPETEMHSKNLAIVWAPNLLRSKELEAGGGAAALQGVGIQAVVTECLICYCDIIFSDKMPSYGSQDSGRGDKKPRPKSLAISTPTRLLSLEEARERAFITHLAPKKFIDVGGGPKNVPSKYHTVIDLPGYRKKVSKENKAASGPKKPSTSTVPPAAAAASGTGGWKSIFSKPRSGSVKKTRKPSIQDSVAIGSGQAKALTEEDVHNWKRHLRSAKSAESLFSMTTAASSRASSISSRASHSNTETAGSRHDASTTGAGVKGPSHIFQLTHKRSLSSDASAVLQHGYISFEASSQPPTHVHEDEPGRQSFVRGDSSRKALHRRVPSAPNTPRQDRKLASERSETSGSDEMDISFDSFMYPKSQKRGDINIDKAIKSRLLQVAEKNRSAKSSEELTSSPLKRSAKSPPQGRKKAKGADHADSSDDELSPRVAPPSARKVTASCSVLAANKAETSPYDNDERETRMHQFYSRFHDYAEILSDDDAGAVTTPGSQGTMSVSSSGCNMQDVLDQIDTRLAMNAQLFSRQGNYPVDDPPKSKETVFSSAIETTTTSIIAASTRETEFSVSPTTCNTLAKSASLPRETEFPATFNTAPRGMSGRHQPGSEQGNVEIGKRKVDTCPVEESGAKPPAAAAAAAAQTTLHKAADKSANSSACSTRVVRRHAEFHPSSNTTAKDLQNLHELLDSLERQNPESTAHIKSRSLPTTHSSPQKQRNHTQHHNDRSPQRQHTPTSTSSFMPPDLSTFDQRLPAGLAANSGVPAGMSKCLSVPSDIARSLENVTESQSDMLSSVTISELSVSVNSFSNGLGEENTTPLIATLSHSDPRRRRSTSLDSLTDSDRLMTRTLREINRQMDAAFKHDPTNTSGSELSHELFSRHQRWVASDLDLSSSPEVKVKPQPFFDPRSGSGVKRASCESLSQVPVSDQSITPTQASFDGFSQIGIQSASGRASHHKSSSQKSQSHTDSGSETDLDDSFTFVTGAASSTSLGDVTLLSPSSNVSVPQTTSGSLLCPIVDCYTLEQQQNKQHWQGSGTGDVEKQTYRQKDDHIVVETAHVSVQRGSTLSPHRQETIRRTEHRHAHHDNAVRGRSDVANVCKNRLSSSSSSSSLSSSSFEEFEEVASPEADEETKQKCKLTLPLDQDSPQIGQTSCRSRLTAPRLEEGGREELANPNQQWNSGESQLHDRETCERISSLCAVGLMSQRARLSRESSNSSLQSPDSSSVNMMASNCHSPLSNPVREALPDLIQSTTYMGVNPEVDFNRSNMPLQLALYHPDEFSMDIPASVSGHGQHDRGRTSLIHPSPSLPQVHSSSDTVMVKKATLKKSCTDNSIQSASDVNVQQLEREHVTLGGHLSRSERDTGQFWELSVDSDNFRHRSCSDSHVMQSMDMSVHYPEQARDRDGRQGRREEQASSKETSPAPKLLSQLQAEMSAQEHDDQMAMEVDNLCNKLVDDLTSPTQEEEECARRDDMAEQETVCMEVEASFELKGSERSLVSGHSSHAEEMEVQNVLNQGREILMSPISKNGLARGEEASGSQSPAAAASSQRAILGTTATTSTTTTTTAAAATGLADSLVTVRKTSFSKIPRPKQSTESGSPRLAIATTNSRRGEPVMSTSMHADTSPSSSSSSTSSSSRGGHVRRGSESSGVGTGKRPGHIRRSSDTKLTDLRTTSPTSRPNSVGSKSDTSKSVTSPRGRTPDIRSGGACDTGARSSRIRLSHRVPSPQCERAAEGSVLCLSKAQSKIPSPIPKPRKISASSKGVDVGASSKGDNTSPLTDDVLEVTKQSMRRENSARGRNAAMKKEVESSGKKTVVVRDMPDKAGAKLVIESQPELKKKILTVHAKKVCQPPRQIAEAVEMDIIEKSTGQSQCDHTSNTGVKFSENVEANKENGATKTAPPVAKRKFHYDSRSLPRRSKHLTAQVSLCGHQTSTDGYSDLVGSRSSLDDSVLQLAAERHDLFVPEGMGDARNYLTGSLRVKRSQKMQSLMDLFERGSDSNISDSSGSSPGTRHRDRTFSGSMLGQGGQLTPCMEVGRSDMELTDDDPFLPPASPSKEKRQTCVRPRSASRERFPSRAGTGTVSVASATGNKARASSLRQPSCERLERSGESSEPRQKAASPTSAAPQQFQDISAAASKNSRPPRYRSNSKTRSQSESSESDTTAQLQEVSTARLTAGHAAMSVSYTPHTGNDLFSQTGSDSVLNQQTSVLRRQAVEVRGQHSDSQKNAGAPNSSTSPPSSPWQNSQRRNSIKELRQVFERADADNSLPEPDPPSPIELPRAPAVRPRVRSISPQAECGSERGNVMRLSLELGSSTDPTVTGSLHTDIKSQPLRLGPKPFYGTHK